MESQLNKMEECQTPESVFYGEKEYRQEVLNDGSSISEDKIQNEPNSIHISSLDDDDERNVEEDWPHSCEEKLIQQTIPQTSLHEKYVAKTVLSPGLKGLRPHFYSSCTFVIENQELLNPELSNAVQCSVVFTEGNENAEIKLEIGSSNSELDRALEYALLDMYEGEKSEIILCATKRIGKLRDQHVLPVPCLKCVVILKKITNYLKFSKVPLVNATKEEKFAVALNEKSHGINLFKKQQFVDAFHRFSAGAKILMTLESEELKADPSIQCLYSTLCSNMAECQLKENNPTQAIALCEKALAHDSSSVKALFRQASAFWSVGDTDRADSVLRRLLELDPNNPAAKRLNSDIQVKIREYQNEYSKMMKRIFNH